METQAATPNRERRIVRVVSIRELLIDASIRHLEFVHRTRRKIRAMPIPYPEYYE